MIPLIFNSLIFLISAIGSIGDSECKFRANEGLHVFILYPFLILNSKHFCNFCD